jgi:hypothetical protein
VVALHTLLFPIYCAIRLAGIGMDRPYVALLKSDFCVCGIDSGHAVTRLLAARIFEWPEARFYGLFGPGVNPFMGFIVVPFVTALFWIVTSVVVGGAIGAALLAIVRSRSKAANSRQREPQ